MNIKKFFLCTLLTLTVFLVFILNFNFNTVTNKSSNFSSESHQIETTTEPTDIKTSDNTSGVQTLPIPDNNSKLGITLLNPEN